MVGLRTAEGVSLVEIGEMFGEQYVQKIHSAAEPFVRCGWLKKEEQRLACVEQHWLVADAVIAELF